MSILSRLFGGGGAAPKSDPDPETYKDFRIFAQPVKEGGSFRVAARIEKEIDGVLRSHHMIRADTCDAEETAQEMSTRKAKMLIDQQGEKIF
jgi:hypothetical protein